MVVGLPYNNSFRALQLLSALFLQGELALDSVYNRVCRRSDWGYRVVLGCLAA